MLANDDPYWQEHLELFTTDLPSFGKDTTIWGRTHVKEERARDHVFLGYPMPQKGTWFYACMDPYAHHVSYTLTMAMYRVPRGTAIGEVAGPAEASEMTTIKLGNAFAYVYPEIQTMAIWEAYFLQPYRRHPVSHDAGMLGFWQAFEAWLLERWPETTLLLTHDHDVDVPEHYQGLLAARGFGPWADGVYGKRIHP